MKFSDNLMDWYPIHKYLIKDEFVLRDIKLWNEFILRDIQLIGGLSCLFTTSIQQDTKKCMLLTAIGLPEEMSNHCYVLTLKVRGFC